MSYVSYNCLMIYQLDIFKKKGETSEKARKRY